MPTPPEKAGLPFWQLSLTALMERRDSSPGGLSAAEAAARLVPFGLNLIHAERKQALLPQFLTKFRNPLVIILLTASALSAFTGDSVSFFIISAIVLTSVTLDFVQEYRAGHAAEHSKSRPNPWLTACSLTVVAVAVLLPIAPAGGYLGFVATPALVFLILILLLLAYLLAVEGVKQWFFRHMAPE